MGVGTEGIEEILNVPGRIECLALRANISQRQCAINQAQARIDPHGPLRPCLRCGQEDRVREIWPYAKKYKKRIKTCS